MESFFNTHGFRDTFRLEGSDANVHCPRCGCYHGTKLGLRTNVVSRNCIGGCDTTYRHGKFILAIGGGGDFPIRYDHSNILTPYKSNTGILKRLGECGYRMVNPSEVTGLDMVLEGDWLLPQNNLRRNSLDTIICPEDTFVRFVEKNCPLYLEITHTMNGQKMTTYLKYQEIPIMERVRRAMRSLISNV